MSGIELIQHFLKVDNAGGPWKFLAAHGTLMTWQPLPSTVKLGPMKECFQNALNLSLKEGYAYCEGLAVDNDYAQHHAWCLDPKSGHVIEPTWPQPFENVTPYYFGVALDLEFVKKMAKAGRDCMLDNGSGRCPLNNYPISDWKYVTPAATKLLL